MTKTQIAIIAVAATGIYAGVSMFQDHAYEKEKKIIEAQLQTHMPAFCPLAYVTHGKDYVHAYCTLDKSMAGPNTEESRMILYNAMKSWQKLNPGYAQHALSVRFTNEDWGGGGKK